MHPSLSDPPALSELEQSALCAINHCEPDKLLQSQALIEGETTVIMTRQGDIIVDKACLHCY